MKANAVASQTGNRVVSLNANATLGKTREPMNQNLITAGAQRRQPATIAESNAGHADAMG
jgi:hypothetical protein